MAEHIAKVEDAPVNLPGYIAVALERVIMVRSTFSEKMAAAGKTLNQASNARHSHFVGVLQRVCDALKPLMTTDVFDVYGMKEAAANISAKKHGENTPLKNIFEVLELYEPSYDFLNAPDVESQPSRPEFTVEQEEEDSLFEAIFALTTLLLDFNKLRSKISDLWAKHASGAMDLAAVSVAVNAAIELARGFEEEINPLLQKNGGASEMLAHYWRAVGLAMGGMDVETPKRMGDDYNFDAYDFANNLYTNTMAVIIAFVNANPLKETPYYNGKYGWYAQLVRNRPTDNRQRYNRDKVALLEMLGDLVLIYNNGTILDDILTTGLANIRLNQHNKPKSTVEVPVWLSFACQVYLDTLYNVEPDVGWEAMQRTRTLVESAISNVPPRYKERKKLEDQFKTLIIDPIAMIRTTIGHRYEDWQFYKRHPLFCGLWINKIRCIFHRESISYAAPPAAILYATQFYHALRQEGLLEQEWEDLEKLRRMQPDSAFFLGEPPTTYYDYYSTYCVTGGLSVTNFAPNRRSKRPTIAPQNRRIMKFLGPMSAHWAQRTDPPGDQRILSADTIRQWIDESDYSSGLEEKPQIDQLLDELAEVVQDEIPALEFNYIAMSDICQELLMRITNRFQDEIGPTFKKRFIQQDSNAHFTVGFAFAGAAGRIEPNKETVPTFAFLHMAKETTQEWLSEGYGNRITSGKILELAS